MTVVGGLPDAVANVNEARQLILHAGLPKTGSSALQVGFARNLAVLQRLDINYPNIRDDSRATRGKVTAGNSGGLSDYLRNGSSHSDSAPLNELRRTLLAAPQQGVLLSAENMFFGKPETIHAVRQVAKDAGFRVRAVMYVRDIVPWMVSTYAQHVRNNGFTGSIEAFLDTFEPSISRMQRHIGAYVDVLGDDSVTILPYEQYRHGLLQSFLAEVLGWKGQEQDLKIPGQINRTLSAQEIRWMRHANQYASNPKAPRVLAETLTSRAPTEPSSLALTHQEVTRLRRRGKPQVEWINETFFDGREVIRVGDAPTTETGNEIPLVPAEQTLVEAAIDIIAERAPTHSPDERLKSAREKLREERQRRRRAEARLASHANEAAAPPHGGPTGPSEQPGPRRRLHLRRNTSD